MKAVKGPIIGYYGAIADWFDCDILVKLVKEFPKASIVLIGQVDNTEVKEIAEKYRNIILLGEKPYAQLPSYLQFFDVCIIPFKLTSLIKATSPVKIYEYLAAGKPVVTTNMPELEDYKSVIYKTSTPKAFTQAVKQALIEKSNTIKKTRQEIAKQHTWEMRAQALQIAIADISFPKVSIVILSYNKVAYTLKCIKSVLENSKYPTMEVIVVDNGSSKQTVTALKQVTKDSRLKFVFNKENLGFGQGNNVGLEKATGDYIIVLNNDTVITPGWIERLVYHAKQPDVGLVGPVTNAIGNEARIRIRYDIDDKEDVYETVASYTYRHWGNVLNLKMIAAFCWIIRRDVYKKIGGFDPLYGKAFFEDDDYCMRVRQANLQIVCAEDVFIHHYGSVTVNSLKHLEQNELFQLNKKKFEEKWHTTWTTHKSR